MSTGIENKNHDISLLTTEILYHDNPHGQETSVCQLQTDMTISWEVATNSYAHVHLCDKSISLLRQTALFELIWKRESVRERERKKPGRLSERKTESTADAVPISWISSTAFSAIKLQVIWLRANEMHTWNSVKVLAAELACFANSPDVQLYCDPNTNHQTNLNIASCPDHIYFVMWK